MKTPTPSAGAVRAAEKLTGGPDDKLHITGEGWCDVEEIATIIDKETGLADLQNLLWQCATLLEAGHPEFDIRANHAIAARVRAALAKHQGNK